MMTSEEVLVCLKLKLFYIIRACTADDKLLIANKIFDLELLSTCILYNYEDEHNNYLATYITT